MNNCLTCAHWTNEAKANAKGEHWCRRLNTWAEPSFYCREYSTMPMNGNPDEWYTIAEISDKCHVSYEAVRYWISTGRLKAWPIASDVVRLAGQFAIQWRIEKATADRYVEWYNSIVSR